MTTAYKGLCRPSRLAALVLAGMGAIAPLAAGVAATLPALGDAAHPERHPGKMIWADLVTPDLAAAERFYGGMFAWEFAPFNEGAKDCALATLGGHPIGCLVQRALPPGEPRQSAWLSYFAVRDLDAARALALQEGAKNLAGPVSYQGHGRQAVLTDPEGAVFGMLASSSGDPADFRAAPGEWYWCSLMAPDPGLDAAFYQKVFDYEVFSLPSEGLAEHLILATDDLARGSVNSMPGLVARRHPHWLNFVRVTDAAASAAKAVALGGRILVEPHIDRFGGRTAVVADPAGAPVGLMEWVALDPKAVSK